MSGGSIRDLIRLVANASNFVDEGETRISTTAVHGAINDLRGVYMRFLMITPRDYVCLAAIARRKSIATGKDDYSTEVNRLLFNGCLLEYIENGEPWLDVHPVLIETKEFRNACTAHDSKTS